MVPDPQPAEESIYVFSLDRFHVGTRETGKMVNCHNVKIEKA